MSPPSEECNIWEVFICLQADWHISTRGIVPVQIVPEQISIGCAVTEHGCPNGPPMPHFIKKAPETYVNNIAQKDRNTFFCVNRTNPRA